MRQFFAPIQYPSHALGWLHWREFPHWQSLPLWRFQHRSSVHYAQSQNAFFRYQQGCLFVAHVRLMFRARLCASSVWQSGFASYQREQSYPHWLLRYRPHSVCLFLAHRGDQILRLEFSAYPLLQICHYRFSAHRYHQFGHHFLRKKACWRAQQCPASLHPCGLQRCHFDIVLKQWFLPLMFHSL